MGWFFGCFGRKNKNPRSNNGDQSLLLPQPLPFSPSQPSSIPIKNLNPLKEQVFLRTRPLSTSAPPVRLGYGILLQENAEKMSEKNKCIKKKEEDPWSQVDDLAEELEDLRKQIEKGTTAAHDSNSNQITEEVTFLKSCGALSQSPSELEKKEVETISTSSYSRGWHSWFLPASINSSPALAKIPQPQISVGKRRVAIQGLQVASSSSSTPAKEACGIIHRRNEMKSKDNLHVGSLVTSEHVMEYLEKQNNSGNPPVVIHDSWMGESQPCDAKMNVMSTPTPLKHNKVSGNSSALTKQIEEHELYIACMDKSSSTKDVNASRFKSIDSLKISALPSAQVMNEAIITRGTTSNTMGSHERDDETIKILEQVNHACDNVISKKQSADFVSSSVIGNHRYAAVDSTVSASQVLSESSSFSTTAENSCESPSASVSSSFNATSADIKSKFKGAHNHGSCFQSDTIVSCSIDSEQTVSDLNHGYCISKYGKLKREESVISCSSEGGPAMASYKEKVATTPHQKYGSKKTTMVTSLQNDTVDEGYSVDSFSDPMSHGSGENHDDPSKCVDSNGVALQPKKSDSIESPRMPPHELTSTPIACYKPQRVRNQPQSPVLTPVENEFQWKKLQEKENKTTDPISSARLRSIVPTPSSLKRDIPESIDTNNVLASRKEGWDENTYRGSKNMNSYVSEKEAVVSITASFSEWSRPSKEDEGSHKTLQNDDILHKDFIAVDMSLSHWLNPSSSSKLDGGLECALVTPKNCLPRPPVLPIQSQVSPNLAQTERPILGQLSPKVAQNDRPNLYPFPGYRQQHNTCVTQTVHWDGQGIPNTTTKYNEDQKVKWFSSPFEVRLERELGKQQEAGLQKRLFGKPTSGDR